jgi:histidyl-tRNA synthetase
MEYLDLYTRKSGEEIVGQLFVISGRDEGKEDRPKAIRPEMTPSLARMIAQHQSSLPRPIKWFCIARMCRAERGQRGRLREFWQWNADILGVDHATADAEVISVALDALLAMGLTPDDLEVRINSRTLLTQMLTGIGVDEGQLTAVYAALDKRAKIPAEAFLEMLSRIGLPDSHINSISAMMELKSLENVASFIEQFPTKEASKPLQQLAQVFDALDGLGKRPFCRFDMGVVRGLAYYTGPVFEIFDKRADLRALAGGGRYDNLLSVMGGQPMPAVGFGMGDVVLAELLKEVNKLPTGENSIDSYVIPLSEDRMPDVLRLVARLRARGKSVDYPLSPGNLGKLMKRADALGARQVILVGGSEWDRGQYKIRNMDDGSEYEVPRQEWES